MSVEYQEGDLRAARGSVARAALIAAGVELFGKYSPEGASTRMLASRAGVNISAISYYFGGKAGLYEAVIAHIADGLLGCTEDIRAQGEAVLASPGLSSLTALQGLQDMLAGVAGLFVSSRDLPVWAKVIVREHVDPSPAYSILYKGYMQPLLLLLARFVAACTGLDADSQEAKVRGHALFGQILGFLIGREALLRRLGAAELEPSHVALIQSILRENTRACLNTGGL